MKTHLQMTSLGFEPRDCQHGGTFVRGERMNATDNGWYCDDCIKEVHVDIDPAIEEAVMTHAAYFFYDHPEFGIAAFQRHFKMTYPRAKRILDAWERIGFIEKFSLDRGTVIYRLATKKEK